MLLTTVLYFLAQDIIVLMVISMAIKLEKFVFKLPTLFLAFVIFHVNYVYIREDPVNRNGGSYKTRCLKENTVRNVSFHNSCWF